MGVRFDFIKGEGPAIENPLRSEGDLDRVRRFEPREALAPVLEAIRQIKGELAGRVPLIGFAGAPFTLASYAIEGGHSSNFAHTKALMYGSPAAWHRLCDLLAEMSAEYLVAQIEAGVDAVQLFDSWVGALNADDYREFILPHTRKIFERLSAYPVPTIHFGVGTSAILDQLRDAGGDVIGADWRIPLDEAWTRIGPDRAIQGNLDPTVLLGAAGPHPRRDRRRPDPRRGPARPHLQSGARDSSDDAARTRPGCRAVRAPADANMKKYKSAKSSKCKCKVQSGGA